MSFILKKSYHVLQIANGTVSHTARPSGRIQRNTAANPALTVTDTISTDIPSTSAVAVANAAKTRPPGETSCLALVAEAATMSTAFDLHVSLLQCAGATAAARRTAVLVLVIVAARVQRVTASQLRELRNRSRVEKCCAPSPFPVQQIFKHAGKNVREQQEVHEHDGHAAHGNELWMQRSQPCMKPSSRRSSEDDTDNPRRREDSWREVEEHRQVRVRHWVFTYLYPRRSDGSGCASVQFKDCVGSFTDCWHHHDCLVRLRGTSGTSRWD